VLAFVSAVLIDRVHDVRLYQSADCLPRCTTASRQNVVGIEQNLTERHIDQRQGRNASGVRVLSLAPKNFWSGGEPRSSQSLEESPVHFPRRCSDTRSRPFTCGEACRSGPNVTVRCLVLFYYPAVDSERVGGRCGWATSCWVIVTLEPSVVSKAIGWSCQRFRNDS